MYVVEADSKIPHSTDDLKVVYEFIGDPDEVRDFKQNIGSLVLSAINLGDVEPENGYLLLRQLQENDDVRAMHQSNFEMVIGDSEVLKNERMRDLTVTAAGGGITTEELWKELKSLELFEPGGSQDIIWLNKDGLATELNEGKLDTVTQTDIDNVHGEDSLEARLAKELGLNIDAFQHELVRDRFGAARLLSDREHTSLGNLDENGNYQPVVTVLNRDYYTPQA